MTWDAHQPYTPPPLPPAIDLKNPAFFELLLKARTELAELNGYSSALPNPLLLLSPAILKESVASSEIENIHTTFLDALQNELFPEPERNAPDKEVLRYREAIFWGFEQLQKLPISTRIIQGIEAKLLPDSEGEYRRQQNQIKNIATGEVVYTPPIAGEIPQLLSNWENFANQDPEAIDPVLKSAIAHYQFEAVHPFADGNGRTGRILVVLQLVQDKVLKLPILYVSGYIQKNRTEYYRLLRRITSHQDWVPYLQFMLKGFHAQALETKAFVLNIRDLFESFREKIKNALPKIYSGDLIELLFSFPVISPVKLGEKMDIHYTTASRHLKALAEKGYLKNVKLGKYQLFINEALVQILK
ncbi:MAG TPA: Fic/DOC family N-terminal domain-containing protein [bacterium]|nr:Fic/DOC family N-terminal domain-containing protein [bacterium]